MQGGFPFKPSSTGAQTDPMVGGGQPLANGHPGGQSFIAHNGHGGPLGPAGAASMPRPALAVPVAATSALGPRPIGGMVGMQPTQPSHIAPHAGGQMPSNIPASMPKPMAFASPGGPAAMSQHQQPALGQPWSAQPRAPLAQSGAPRPAAPAALQNNPHQQPIQQIATQAIQPGPRSFGPGQLQQPPSSSSSFGPRPVGTLQGAAGAAPMPQPQQHATVQPQGPTAPGQLGPRAPIGVQPSLAAPAHAMGQAPSGSGLVAASIGVSAVSSGPLGPRPAMHGPGQHQPQPGQGSMQPHPQQQQHLQHAQQHPAGTGAPGMVHRGPVMGGAPGHQGPMHAQPQPQLQVQPALTPAGGVPGQHGTGGPRPLAHQQMQPPPQQPLQQQQSQPQHHQQAQGPFRPAPAAPGPAAGGGGGGGGPPLQAHLQPGVQLQSMQSFTAGGGPQPASQPASQQQQQQQPFGGQRTLGGPGPGGMGGGPPGRSGPPLALSGSGPPMAHGQNPQMVHGPPQQQHMQQQGGGVPRLPLSPPTGMMQAPPVRAPTPPVSASRMAGQGTTPGSAVSQRIDPTAIPRPRYTSPLNPVRYNTSGEGFNVAPQAWSDYAGDDSTSGNANPRYLRVSLHHVPANKDLLKDTRVPLAVSLTPLARPAVHFGERPPSVVDFGDDGPVRCQRCRSYVSPHAKWSDGGRRWSCAMCGEVNACPDYYVGPIDQYGQRRDRFERPELCCGTVELVAPRSYLIRPPQPSVFVFVIEASYLSIASGAFGCAVAAVKGCLDGLAALPEAEGRARAGLLVFDSSLHFFDISAGLPEPRIAVSSDIDDPFCPLAPDQFTPPLNGASRAHLDAALNRLPAMFPPGSARSMQASSGAAVKAAIDAASGSGGRVIVFQSSLPLLGEGRLSTREKATLYGGEKERELYTPVAGPPGAWYGDLARTAASKGVGVDLRLFGGNFLDVGTIGQFPALTGGSVKTYPTFAPPTTHGAAAGGGGGPTTATSRPGGGPCAAPSPSPTQGVVSVTPVPFEISERVRCELFELVTRCMGSEAVLKVRASRGLKVVKYVGNLLERPSGEADLGVVDSESGIVVTLALDGNDTRDGDELFLQAALMYTSAGGQRRIRVHNARLQATDSVQSAFRHADMDTVLSTMLRKSVSTCLSKDVRFVWADHTEAATEMLHAYRRHCAANSSPGQLILPESLKLLPLYLSAIEKLGAFTPNRQPQAPGGGPAGVGPDGKPLPRPGTATAAGGSGRGAFGDVAVRADARAAELLTLNGLAPARLVPLIYPRLYVLHNMAPAHGVPLETEEDVAAATGGGSSGEDHLAHLVPQEPLGLTFAQLMRVVTPPTTFPSLDQVASHGLHLLEHASALLLHVGPDCDEELLSGLFGEGVSSPAQLPPGVELPRLATPLSLRVRTVITAIRARRPPYLPLHVIVPSDNEGRDRFAIALVEDRNGAAHSYVDLLCSMHASIQQRLTAA